MLVIDKIKKFGDNIYVQRDKISLWLRQCTLDILFNIMTFGKNDLATRIHGRARLNLLTKYDIMRQEKRRIE